MFQGLEGFYWFTGVVEDRKDPEKRGRVRVRIWALHSKEKQINDKTGQGIPTDHLPWATVLRPTTSAAMDGIGSAPVGIVEGTWVVGFALDGEAFNDLIVIGTLGGRPEDPPRDNNGRDGFVDPRTEEEIDGSPRYINKIENRDPSYPGMQIPQGRYPQEKWLNEVDVNRLARAEKLDQTYIKPKTDSLKKKILTAFDTEWNEKSPAYAAVYPYNEVRETECGHVIELDSTKEAERIHVWHKKGSYTEFQPDGSIQLRAQKDLFTIGIGKINLYSEDEINLTAKDNLGIRSNNGDVKIKTAKGSFRVDAAESVEIIARGKNSLHLTAEDGPLIARTTKGAMVLNSMTSISMAATTGSIQHIAPLGSISSMAAGSVTLTSASGTVGLSALSGDVSLSAAASSIVANAMRNFEMNALTGGITGLSSNSILWKSKLGQISFITEIGNIIAQAEAGLSLLTNTGEMLMRATTGDMILQTLGDAATMALNSATSLGIDTTLGSISMTTANPFGTGLSSDRSVEVRSNEIVSVNSTDSNVEISAPNGLIGLSAPEIELDSPILRLVSEDLVLEGTNSLSIWTTAGNILIDSSSDLDINAVDEINLTAGGIMNLSSDSTVANSNEFSLETVNDLFLTAGGLGSLVGNSISLESDTTFEINGNTVTVTSNGDVTIQQGSGLSAASVVLSGGEVYINGNVIHLNGPGGATLDSYGSTLRDIFDTRYVQI